MTGIKQHTLFYFCSLLFTCAAISGNEIKEFLTESTRSVPNLPSLFLSDSQPDYVTFTFSRPLSLSSYEGEIKDVKIEAGRLTNYIHIKLSEQNFHSILEFNEHPFKSDAEEIRYDSVLNFNPHALEGHLKFIQKENEENYFILDYCFNRAQVDKDPQGYIKLSFDKFTQALKVFFINEKRYFQMMGDS